VTGCREASMKVGAALSDDKICSNSGDRSSCSAQHRDHGRRVADANVAQYFEAEPLI